MWIVVAIVAVFGGLVMIVRAFGERTAPVEPPLPAAKINDGRGFEEPKPARRISFGMIFAGVGVIGFGLLAALIAAISSIDWSYTMGRPVRRRGKPQLPRLAFGRAGDGTRPTLEGLGVVRRARRAATWLAAARAEQASVPAFEQLEMQLATLDAPEALRARCVEAAADERRHAARCYALARAYGSVPWAPGAIRRDEVVVRDPAVIAVESLIDGCVGEAVAAQVARAGAARAEDPVIAETLSTIADEEHRHAELAWDVVALCIERGGDRVRDALRVAAAEAPTVPDAGPTEVSVREVELIVAHQVAAMRTRLAALAA